MGELEPTGDAVCDDINARKFWKWNVEAQGGFEVRLWLGDCCDMCDYEYFIVTFRGVSMTARLADVRGGDTAWFRPATDDEQNEHELFSERDEKAYCIGPRENRAADAPRLFIVARSIDLVTITASDPG